MDQIFINNMPAPVVGTGVFDRALAVMDAFTPSGYKFLHYASIDAHKMVIETGVRRLSDGGEVTIAAPVTKANLKGEELDALEARLREELAKLPIA